MNRLSLKMKKAGFDYETHFNRVMDDIREDPRGESIIYIHPSYALLIKWNINRAIRTFVIKCNNVNRLTDQVTSEPDVSINTTDDKIYQHVDTFYDKGLNSLLTNIKKNNKLVSVNERKAVIEKIKSLDICWDYRHKIPKYSNVNGYQYTFEYGFGIRSPYVELLFIYLMKKYFGVRVNFKNVYEYYSVIFFGSSLMVTNEALFFDGKCHKFSENIASILPNSEFGSAEYFTYDINTMDEMKYCIGIQYEDIMSFFKLIKPLTDNKDSFVDLHDVTPYFIGKILK